MKFSGNSVMFGAQIVQNGPIAKTRAQRETLPGVRGYRLYQIVGPGPDTLSWTVQGRLVATTFDRLIGIIQDAQSRLNTFATFVDNAGLVYRNCELIDYRPTGRYKRVTINAIDWYTVEYSATIEQASR